VPVKDAPRFLALLHRALAAALAERMRRWAELQADAAAGTSSSLPAGALAFQLAGGQPECALPVERRLTVRDLRRVEDARREAQHQLEEPSLASATRVMVPAAGEARRRRLRQRLVTLVADEMQSCPPSEGVEAVVVLELFERVTGEPFTDTPGSLVGHRVRALAKVMGNVAREEAFTPPLLHSQRRGLTIWNSEAPGGGGCGSMETSTGGGRGAGCPSATAADPDGHSGCGAGAVDLQSPVPGAHSGACRRVGDGVAHSVGGGPPAALPGTGRRRAVGGLGRLHAAAAEAGVPGPAAFLVGVGGHGHALGPRAGTYAPPAMVSAHHCPSGGRTCRLVYGICGALAGLLGGVCATSRCSTDVNSLCSPVGTYPAGGRSRSTYACGCSSIIGSSHQQRGGIGSGGPGGAACGAGAGGGRPSATPEPPADDDGSSPPSPSAA
jgi:hypothetical protein